VKALREAHPRSLAPIFIATMAVLLPIALGVVYALHLEGPP
jgi:hypothetical protein